jgi:hypothetical protein
MDLWFAKKHKKKKKIYLLPIQNYMKHSNFQKFCQNHWTLLYSPLSPVQPSVPSSALCPLYGSLSLSSHLHPIRPSSSSMALCPLYGPMPPPQPSNPLQSSTPSMALYSSMAPIPIYPLYGPLSPLRFSVSSMAQWPLYEICYFLTVSGNEDLSCFVKHVSPKRAI